MRGRGPSGRRAKRRYRLAWLAVVLIAVNGLALVVLPRHRFTAIVVHHSASETDDYASIRRYHRTRRHWADAAYHLILSNGSTSVPLGHVEATSRYRHLSYSVATRSVFCNVTAVHLCVIGNYEAHGFPPELRAPLGNAIALLQERYHIPDNRVWFHRGDCGNTACPGKNLSKPAVLSWAKSYAGRCPESVADQQRAVIGRAGFSPQSLPSGYLAGMAALSAFIAAAWIGGHRVFSRPTIRDGRPHRPEIA